MKKTFILIVSTIIIFNLCGCNHLQETTNYQNSDYSATNNHECYYVHNGKTEPTCTSPGKIHWFCKECGNSYDETIPATGHNYVYSHSSSAWKDKNGVLMVTAYYRCTYCGDLKTEIR